ncbi:NADH dehydrogenase [Roseivivax marinus]|uniref:NAD(P)/FAD-dependent oxidoreductase n=1 Tax=Roseivivax marinus TaxID=1379903 RepID=UPI0008D12B66|nr:NAD(P)/FAD-dependent oxidoreductase [Roseivivax marinus]SEK93790.1 NADH dehydrogenase [Roseivivax marinus]
MAERKRIVVVGGGAAGIGLCRSLARRFRDTHDVTLIDRNRTHVWKPLLHEVAAGVLDPNLEEVGYGGHAARWGYRFFRGALEKIDRERQVVTTSPLLDEDGDVLLDRHEIAYDWLILAFGGVSNDFGIPGVRDHALFLEDRGQADRFRQKLLNACLRANARRAEGEDATVPIVIVGGGATGVELSAELVHAARVLNSYGLESFPSDAMRITLLEAGPRLLPALGEDVVAKVEDELTSIGVDVRTGAKVTEVRADAVSVEGMEDLPATLVLWATGIRGDPAVADMSDLELSKADRILVNPDLRTVTDDHILAIGDCAHCEPPGQDGPIPPRAQAAHQMADHAVEVIAALEAGRTPEPFTYRDHGALVSLSRFATVGSLMGNLAGGRVAIEGRLARAAYLSLYRLHIISMHGWLRGLARLAAKPLGRAVRPQIKLH